MIQFCSNCFSVLGKFAEDAIDYDSGMEVFEESLGKKKDSHDAIESAVTMEIEKMKNSSLSLIRLANAMRMYGSQKSKKFVFLSNSTVRKDEIRHFVVIHAPNSFPDLIKTLQDYDAFYQRFNSGKIRRERKITQDARWVRQTGPTWHVRSSPSEEMETIVDSLATQLNFLSLSK